jgi:hypothetical protein
VRGDIVTELLRPQLRPHALQVPPQPLHQASLQAQLPLQSERQKISVRGDIVTELLRPHALQVPPQRLHQASLQAQLPLQSETGRFQ